MKQLKWFSRKFDFSFEQNIFPTILERLSGTSVRLKDKVSKIPIAHLTIKLEGKWSIQEHIGHLIDLEPLWKARIEDVLDGKKYLRPADLENKKTDLAKHNDKKIAILLAEFSNLRSATINSLAQLSEEEVYLSALHPRLEIPMRIMDLSLFVAEHDDHHLARIKSMSNEISKSLLG